MHAGAQQLASAAVLPCAGAVAVVALAGRCAMPKRSADEASLNSAEAAAAAASSQRPVLPPAATATQPTQPQSMDYSNRARAPMVAVLTTDDFRNAAQNLVSPSDVVLEVGCADGITTNLIFKYAADVVGIDTAAGVIAKARQRYPAVDFRQMDGTDLEAVKSLRPRFDKVFVDIAGVISLEALLPLLAQLDDALQPGLVVVKSKALAKVRWTPASIAADRYLEPSAFVPHLSVIRLRGEHAGIDCARPCSCKTSYSEARMHCSSRSRLVLTLTAQPQAAAAAQMQRGRARIIAIVVRSSQWGSSVVAPCQWRACSGSVLRWRISWRPMGCSTAFKPQRAPGRTLHRSHRRIL
jgi:SAM-dependent methyltransferase